MRESLYIKDDDSMLSFIQGNFITFTNMKDSDIEGIIKYRISPINVSVHTTNPELRMKMLNNKKAGEIMDILQRLTEKGININCQIVLCPEVNDGDELLKTINDLYSLYPSVSNVAVVPIGLTKFREGLYSVNGYNKNKAKEVIYSLRPIQKKITEETGETFVRLADEFYILAGEPVPEEEHYGDFEQLEDGIGMLRYFKLCVDEALQEMDIDCSGREIGFVTGVSAYEHILNAAKNIEEKINIRISVYKVENDFFGPCITVSGLITGQDILKQLKGKIKEETIFIPSNMLKSGEEVFLDDIKVSDLSKELKAKVVPVRYTGEDIIEKIINEVI
jgi:putative radical SAM enzyme (TIGR03279 family)